jgi:hypothetical protein
MVWDLKLQNVTANRHLGASVVSARAVGVFLVLRTAGQRALVDVQTMKT